MTIKKEEKTILDYKLKEAWFETLWELIELDRFKTLDKYNLEQDSRKRKYLVVSMLKEFSILKKELKYLVEYYDNFNEEIDYAIKYCMSIKNFDRLLWFYYMSALLLEIILELNLWYLLYDSEYELRKCLKFMINDINNESFRKWNQKWDFEKAEKYLTKILNQFENEMNMLTFVDL